MNKGRILYISYDGMSDPLGQSQVLPYLTALTNLGFEITLISAEKPERFKNLPANFASTLKSYGLDWHPIMYTKSPPILSTIKDISAIKKLASSLHLKKNFQIVHCRSYVASLAGVWLKKKFGLKFLFDMRGFWADERVDGKIWNLSLPHFKLVYNYFKRKENLFLETADHTVSLTHNAANEIHMWENIKGQPIPISVIPCCADLDFFDPKKISAEQKQILKNKLSIHEATFILTYVGSIGTWYLSDEMLLFFKRLLFTMNDSVFLIYTQEDSQIIYKKAGELDLPLNRIKVLPVNRAEMPLYLSITDLSLFFIKNAFSKKASSPVKQGELMAMGIPMICNSGVGDVDLIVNDTHCGMILETLNESAFDNAIRKWDVLKNIPQQTIREGAFKWYSLSEGVNQYAKIYNQLMN